MTKTSTRPQPGDRFHALAAGLSIATSPSMFAQPFILTRGRTVTLTEAMIASTIDKLGGSWLDLLDDEEAQIEKWGERKIAPGPWPEDLDRFVKGSVEAIVERDRLRHEAQGIADEAKRAAALAGIDKRLGRPKGSSSQWIKGDAERARYREPGPDAR